MYTVAVIQARMGSSRLPGKSMLDLDGEPVLVRVTERALAADRVDEVVVATSSEPQDDIVAWAVDSMDVTVTRGSESDVLGRMYDAAAACGAEGVVRISADNPLVSPVYLSHIAAVLSDGDYDYVSSSMRRTFPLGVTAEAFTFESFQTVEAEATEPHHREHVTPYYRESSRFRRHNVVSERVFADPVLHDRTDLRLTLDELDDYRLLSRVYEAVEFDAYLPVEDAVRYVDDHELGTLNRDVTQKSARETEE